MSKADDLILANGPYPPVPAVERRLVGLTHHPTIWEAAAPMIATLPTGERIELPAGTVLREDTRPPPIRLASAEEERAILSQVVGYTIRERRGERTQIIVSDAEGRTIELMHVTPAMLMRAADRRVHGEEIAQ